MGRRVLVQPPVQRRSSAQPMHTGNNNHAAASAPAALRNLQATLHTHAKVNTGHMSDTSTGSPGSDARVPDKKCIASVG
jgi:hypothetical protein